MRRVWTTVLTVWALLAILAVLAWTRHQAAPVTQASPAIRIIRSAGAPAQTVVLAPHATTQTSPGTGGGAAASLPPTTVAAAGPTATPVAVQAATHATTRTS